MTESEDSEWLESFDSVPNDSQRIAPIITDTDGNSGKILIKT